MATTSPVSTVSASVGPNPLKSGDSVTATLSGCDRDAGIGDDRRKRRWPGGLPAVVALPESGAQAEVEDAVVGDDAEGSATISGRRSAGRHVHDGRGPSRHASDEHGSPTETSVSAGAINEPNVRATIVNTARTVAASTMWT
jgi:hypothetical protein